MIIAPFVLILFFIFLLFSYFIFTDFTKKNEERYALENIQRVKNLIESEINEFDLFSKGLAFWDQSYNLADSPDQKYIDGNLKESNFNYFNFSFIAFTDLNANEIFSKNNCFKSNNHFDSFLKNLLANQEIKEALKNKSETKGVFGFDGNEFIISVNPVYGNSRIKPPNGFLITGREFNKIGLFKIKLNPDGLSYRLFSDIDNNPENNKIKSDLILLDQFIAFDKERPGIISYLLIRNISNQPEIILKIIQSSEIFNLSREAIILFAISSIVIVFILISLFLLFFEKFVISKIIRLNQNVGLMTVNKIFNLNNGIKPENLKAGDEIDSLNSNIYKLLSIISYRNNLENLAIGVFNSYLRLNKNNTDDFIDDTLKKVGSFSGSDRVSILLFSESKNNAAFFYDWYAPGIKNFIEKYKNISIKEIEWLYNRIKAEGICCMQSIKDLPEDQKKLKKFLNSSEIKSFLSIGMFLEDNLMGLIKFDTVLEEKNWSGEDVELLKTIAGILAYAIAKFKPGVFIND